VKYLVDPPSYDEMKEILRKLNLRPMYLIRKEEDLYKKTFKGKYFTDDQWTRILVDNPILIQRPVVVRGDKAVVARPPKRIHELFQAEPK
jgi:arsenate reductase